MPRPDPQGAPQGEGCDPVGLHRSRGRPDGAEPRSRRLRRQERQPDRPLLRPASSARRHGLQRGRPAREDRPTGCRQSRRPDRPRDHDPQGARARPLQRGDRQGALGRAADGEVPPDEHLPEARRQEPHRGRAVRLRARPDRQSAERPRLAGNGALIPPRPRRRPNRQRRSGESGRRSNTVLYEIKIDNTGDGRPDLGYQFRFNTATRNPNTFLYNTGPITSLSDSSWNRPQTYSVTLVQFDEQGKPEGKSKVLGTNIPTPPDNIGPRSTPNYDNLAAAAVTSLPSGIKVFAGQRDDPFFVDLGSIFDLAGLRPFNPFHLLPLPADAGRDALKNYNTHSIEIQVPISQLTGFSNTTIGIYASASRQKARILDPSGQVRSRGPWVQISRLGNPLINEVVIPLGDKDYWNREDPADDQQF